MTILAHAPAPITALDRKRAGYFNLKLPAVPAPAVHGEFSPVEVDELSATADTDDCVDATASDPSTWDAWTDASVWNPADDAEPAGPSPEDAAYNLGFGLGEADPSPFRFWPADEASWGEKTAFFAGISAGFQAKTYARHLARIEREWGLAGPTDELPARTTAEHVRALQAGLMVEAASPTAEKWSMARAGVIDEDVFPARCRELAGLV